jgi:hypothetical protein
MEQQGGFAVRLADRWRPAMVPAVATGLVLLERVLMDEMGSPVTLLRALGDLEQPRTDPVASVIAVMALAAELLVGYVLVALVLGSLCMLPGWMGRLAARVTSLVTPVMVRRLLDLLVGGALLAQVALVPPAASSGHRWSGSHLASTASSPVSGLVGSAIVGDPVLTSVGTGWVPWPEDQSEPAGARPNLRRSAAPLPPWLGGGPSNAAPGHGDKAGGTRVPGDRDERGGTAVAGHVVEVGDTLWDIAAARLVPAERSALNIHLYWRQIYRANRSVIGAHPDLIYPGTRLHMPPFRRAR